MTDEPPIERAPTTEEEMRAHTVGELVVHGTTIHLRRLRPWSGRASTSARRPGSEPSSATGFGGSSMSARRPCPGSPAKPVIDIVLAVPDSSDEPTYVPDMEAAGYVVRIREPEWYEHRVFKGPDTNINLHTFTDDAVGLRRDRSDGPVPRLAPHPRRRA